MTAADFSECLSQDQALQTARTEGMCKLLLHKVIKSSSEGNLTSWSRPNNSTLVQNKSQRRSPRRLWPWSFGNWGTRRDIEIQQQKRSQSLKVLVLSLGNESLEEALRSAVEIILAKVNIVDRFWCDTLSWNFWLTFLISFLITD